MLGHTRRHCASMTRSTPSTKSATVPKAISSGAHRRRPPRLQPELRPGRVQVDLLRSESQREPARREPHRLHAEDPAVEVARGVEIADGEHQVVEAIERHRARWVKTDSGRNAETIQLGVSTISLILRSTATLERMYASSRESPRSVTRWSIM